MYIFPVASDVIPFSCTSEVVSITLAQTFTPASEWQAINPPAVRVATRLFSAPGVLLKLAVPRNRPVE